MRMNRKEKVIVDEDKFENILMHNECYNIQYHVLKKTKTYKNYKKKIYKLKYMCCF